MSASISALTIVILRGHGDTLRKLWDDLVSFIGGNHWLFIGSLGIVTAAKIAHVLYLLARAEVEGTDRREDE